MIFCSKCGASNQDGAQFCAQCGSPLFSEGQVQDSVMTAITEDMPAAGSQDANQKLFDEVLPQQQPQAAPQQNFAPYTGAVVAPLTPKCKTFGIISFILGIWATAFCWLGIFPIVGIIVGIIMVVCGILAIVFSGISRKEGNFKLAKLGKVFGIIGLILSAICLIIGIIVTIGVMQNSGTIY